MKYIYRVLNYMAWFWFMEWLILVYIINRIMHGRLEIWNLSSRVHIRYLTRSLRSLVRYRCEHSKINSISPPAHVSLVNPSTVTGFILKRRFREKAAKTYQTFSSHTVNFRFPYDVSTNPVKYIHSGACADCRGDVNVFKKLSFRYSHYHQMRFPICEIGICK